MASGSKGSKNESAAASIPLSNGGWNSFFHSLEKIPRKALLSVLGPVLLVCIGYVAWQRYGAAHLNLAYYGLTADSLIVTDRPAWIRSDVTQDVFKGGSLGRLSLLDRQMSATVYNAFRAHPWVRKVFRVQKESGQVRIDLEYREPIAMVYYESKTPILQPSVQPTTLGGLPEKQNVLEKPTHSYLPVDSESVLLPTQDFQPDEVRKYMLIYAKDATPTGLVGAEYGDTRIKEALLLCKLVKSVRDDLLLERVYIYPDASRSVPTKWLLEITTSSGKRIQWGHAPGLEQPGEAGMIAKLQKMTQFLRSPSPSQAGLNELDVSKG